MKKLKSKNVLIFLGAIITILSFVGCEMSQLDMENSVVSKGKPVATTIDPVLGIGGSIVPIDNEEDYILVSQTIENFTLLNSPEVTTSVTNLDPYVFFDENGIELAYDNSIQYNVVGSEDTIFGPVGAVSAQTGIQSTTFLSQLRTEEKITGWYSDNYNLWAGQDNYAGNVNIVNDNTNFYITISTADAADISEIHIDLFTDVNNLPTKRPIPGQAAYTFENLNVDSYVVTIPIPNELDVNALPSDYYFTIHVALVEDANTSNNTTSLAGETAYAGDDNPVFDGKGAWFYIAQFNIVPNIETFEFKTYSTVDSPILVTLSEVENPPVINPEGGSETAFAYDGLNATNFLDLGLTSNSTRWGWSNGPYDAGVYQLEIWAGVGQNDFSKGTHVGTLIFNYDGIEARISYFIDPPYNLDQVHIYVGNTPLPVKNGSYTLSPGQYSIVVEGLSGSQFYEGSISGLSGPVYLVAHAAVLGF